MYKSVSRRAAGYTCSAVCQLWVPSTPATSQNSCENPINCGGFPLHTPPVISLRYHTRPWRARPIKTIKWLHWPQGQNVCQPNQPTPPWQTRVMGANLKGPWSPSTTRGLGAPHPARLVRPALSHMPRQSPTGARLHSQAPPSVNSTGPSPPRRGSAREYCRSSSKSLLLQPRSLKRPLDKQTGASSYSTPAE